MTSLPHAKQTSENAEYIFTDVNSNIEGDEEVFIWDDGTQHAREVNRFDEIVGCLEDMLMDPEFEEARANFCKSRCHYFEDSDNNKLICMELFQQYTALIEEKVESTLKSSLQNFDMEEFLEMLDDHKDELDNEVFELLLSMGDFDTFKDLMLFYKKDVADGVAIKLVGKPIAVHVDKQEDGEERPDLDLGSHVGKLALTT